MQKKRIGRKFMDHLGPNEFNSLNLNDKKYLRTNSVRNVNII